MQYWTTMFFFDRASRNSALWVNPHAEANIGEQIRLLMRRVCQAVTDVPMPHVSAEGPYAGA